MAKPLHFGSLLTLLPDKLCRSALPTALGHVLTLRSAAGSMCQPI